jgi:hypothetical protein
MQGFGGIVGGIIARLDGPFHFRFIGQPLMACVFAVIDGIKDAKLGKPAYFWDLIVSPGHRKELIKDGWKSVWKIFVVAMILEAAYQLKLGHLDYRGYVFIAAFALAIVPYLLLRGPVNRIARLLSKKS